MHRARRRHLFHDIKHRGYTGSFSNLERLLKTWRHAERPQVDEIPLAELGSEPVRDPDTGHAISSVVAAALCIKPRGLLTARHKRKVDALKQGSDAFAKMRRLAMRFNGILRGKKSEALESWIDDAIETDLIPIMRFARVLRRDMEAVKVPSNYLGATDRPKARSIASRPLSGQCVAGLGQSGLEHECCRYRGNRQAGH